MTEKDSDSFNTDNEESEVISVTQTVEANGETIDKEVLIHGEEEAAEKSLVFTAETKVIKGKEEEEKPKVVRKKAAPKKKLSKTDKFLQNQKKLSVKVKEEQKERCADGFDVGQVPEVIMEEVCLIFLSSR